MMKTEEWYLGPNWKINFTGETVTLHSENFGDYIHISEAEVTAVRHAFEIISEYHQKLIDSRHDEDTIG